MTDEHWLPVVGYEGLYEVSDHGDIRSIRSGKLMKLTPEKRHPSYLAVNLTKPIRQQWVHRVHALVLTAFKGPCPQGLETRHLDGNPQNNHLNNLNWGTSIENGRDRIRHKTHCKKGHEFTEANTHLQTTDHGAKRVCRQCRYDNLSKFMQRKRDTART